MLTLKRIVGILLSPGTIILLLLCYGLVRSAFSRGKKKGQGFILAGVACFYLFSTAPLPDLLIRPLENQYKPIDEHQNLTEIQYIVVLSSGVRHNLQIPHTSRLDDFSAMRVAEGVRLYHLSSMQPILIMSGGGDWIKDGDQMVAFAQCLGVPAAKLVSETNSTDTHDNAMEVEALVKNAPFLLVTSAAHLPRAMRIFQLLGMKPIPAPADFRQTERYTFSDFIPSGQALTVMESVIHEYLGLAYLYVYPSRAGK